MGRLMDFAQGHDVPPEQTGPPELPLNKWLLVATAAGDSTNAPEARQAESGKVYLRLPLVVFGGEEGVPEGIGGAVHYQTWWPEDYEKPGQVAPRFVGLLNAMFAHGVALDKSGQERHAARWKRTIEVLDAVAERHDLGPESYPSFPAFLTACAVLAWRENRGSLLVQLRKYRPRDGGDERIVVGRFEDDCPQNREKRKVHVFLPELDPANEDDALPF